MTLPSDFRALCAKILAYSLGEGEYNFSHLNSYDRDNAAFDAWEEIKVELKSALAQSQPPVMTDFRSLLERMADELDYLCQLLRDDRREIHALAAEARAALAQTPADGVIPDSCERGLLPMIVSETGADDEPEIERIVCSAISGGADYLNDMPREVSLERITAAGATFRARYLQGPLEVALAQPLADGKVADSAQVSDGYHTFAELYEHRHSLMLALMRAVARLCWFSQRHADGELPFGSDKWFIAGAELSVGSITYHLPISMLSLAQRTGAAELPVGKPWDGHTASDVIQRLQAWADATLAQPPANGEVAELVAQLRVIGNDYGVRHSADCRRAADLLERQPQPIIKRLPDGSQVIEPQDRVLLVPQPQPVPVSERLPEAGEMTKDGEVWVEEIGGEYPLGDTGDYDWEPHKWILRPIGRFDAKNRLRWLPAHALPLPKEVE